MNGERDGSGVGWVSQVSVEARVKRLEEQIAKGRANVAELRAVATEKIQQGATLTRAQAAAFLTVSTKKLQRMEAAGQLRRCSGLDGVVRYAASDVLRLASALGEEG